MKKRQEGNQQHFLQPFFQRRDTIEREVRYLRDKISLFKIQISTITKGVPMSKIEVREDKRSNARSPDREEKRSMSLPASSKSPERTISPPLKHTAHILKSQQSLASEILAWWVLARCFNYWCLIFLYFIIKIYQYLHPIFNVKASLSSREMPDK